MQTQDVTLHDWFAHMANNASPQAFADVFSQWPAHQQQQWRVAADGMKAGLLPKSVEMGRRQWTRWLLANDFPTAPTTPTSAVEHLIGELVLSRQTFSLHRQEEPLSLAEIMPWCSPTQWADCCTVMNALPAAQWHMLLFAPQQGCAPFIQALADNPTHDATFEKICGKKLVGTALKNSFEQLLDPLRGVGWDVCAHLAALSSEQGFVSPLVYVLRSCANPTKFWHTQWGRDVFDHPLTHKEFKEWEAPHFSSLYSALYWEDEELVHAIVDNGFVMRPNDNRHDMWKETLVDLNRHTPNHPAARAIESALHKLIISEAVKTDVNSLTSSNFNRMRKM